MPSVFLQIMRKKGCFSIDDDFICLKENITAGILIKPKRVLHPNSTEYLVTKCAGGGILSLFFRSISAACLKPDDERVIGMS